MITFAQATPADAPALTEVQTRTFDDDSRRFGGQPSGGPPGYDSAGWQIQMMQRCHYYKILSDQQIIGGLIVYRVRGDHYELGRIYIDPDFQDQGIGAQAMQFIEQAFPQARRWTLDTPSWAVRNHHFYEKMGYVKVREAEAYGNLTFFFEKQIAAHKG